MVNLLCRACSANLRKIKFQICCFLFFLATINFSLGEVGEGEAERGERATVKCLLSM